MKILLILAISMFMTSSVFAACAVGSLDQCKTAAECNALDGGASPKVYMFNESTKSCVKVNGQDQTTCLGVDSSGNAPKAKPVSEEKEGSGSSAAKQL